MHSSPDPFPSSPGPEAARLAPATRALQRPVLGWRSFQPLARPTLPSITDLPHLRHVSSGRAALYHALKLLGAHRGAEVLVPSYHCPTMVAPLLLHGCRPRWYAIDRDGRPLIESLGHGDGAVAIIVAHLFGRPRSLAAVRRWCDAEGVALIEDCAHCHFGQAGERPVGAWGDYATASHTKFLPVPEAGLLASAIWPLPDLALGRVPFTDQLKGFADTLELGCAAGRLPGLQGLLAPLFKLKNHRHGATPPPAEAKAMSAAEAMLAGADMGRVDRQMLAASACLLALLPWGRAITRRQAHEQRYQHGLALAPGAQALFAASDMAPVPYVFPLRIANPSLADQVYHGLRARGHAVFRWDQRWPGTPQLANDEGHHWSSQVLQLLCHQDLDETAVDAAVACTLALLRGDEPARPLP